MSMQRSGRIQYDPLQPCELDPDGQGYHDWANTAVQGTGDPLPGARTCMNCGAFDPGPTDLRVSVKDSPVPLFPAATRSYRTLVGHNPDDDSPTATPGKETF
jgi:hypothetical protein